MTEVIEGMLTEPTSVTIYENGSNRAVAHPAKRSLFDLEPDAQIEYAAKIATSLTRVIEKQVLYSNISGRKYVKVEGWELLGTFLGILPKEREVKELADGSFEASVDLLRASDGVVVGGASALCGMDESRWSKADRYARRSMAITRAVGKAYRSSFSWIISLAGYEPTPAEEMPKDIEIPFAPPTKKEAKGSIYTGTTEQQEKIKAYLLKNGVPEDLWSTIDDRLQGKPSSELKAIVADLMRTDN